MVRSVIITTLTVLACLTVVLEDISYRMYLMKELESTNEMLLFGVQRGELWIERIRDVPDTIDGHDWRFLGLRVADRIAMDSRVLKDYLILRTLPAPRHRLTAFTLPLWMPLVLFAAYPALAFVRGPLRRRRRRKRGGCLSCGYDLTGNVSGVCPECGKDV